MVNVSFFSAYRKEIFIALLLFIVALSLRILFRNTSIVSQPLRADAGLYYSAAFNLRNYRLHSIEPPSSNKPTTLTDLPAGYPIFLAMFINSEKSLIEFISKVTLIQSIFGAIVCVLTYLIARQFLPNGAALLAGILTAISPHLIAIDNYILSESLFLLAFMSGLLALAVSLRHHLPFLSFIAGILISFSAMVRVLACALPVVLGILFFVSNEKKQSKGLHRFATAGAYGCGILCVVVFYTYFLHATCMQPVEYTREKTYKIDLWSPTKLFKSALTPPNFVINSQSHVLAEHGDLKWNQKTDKSFWQSPTAYLNWNSWQRFSVMWNFNNAYNGDVYIYPMIRKGFQENSVLKAVHYGMVQVHWPLFLLTLAAPFFLERKKNPANLSWGSMGCLVTIGSFSYFLAVLTLLGRWLPRYTIPLRPLSYIMAAITFSVILKLVLQVLRDGE